MSIQGLHDLFLLSLQHLVLLNIAERPKLPQITLLWLLVLGIFLCLAPFSTSSKVIQQNSEITGCAKMLPNSSQRGKQHPLASSLVYLCDFASAAWLCCRTKKLTHDFDLDLFIGKSLLCSNLRSLECRQIQNHSMVTVVSGTVHLK